MTAAPALPFLTLDVQDLSVERSDHLILDQLSFSHQSGTLLQITGPNGIGKSTLLGCIANLVHHRGKIQFASETLDLDETPISTHISFISHLNAMSANLTPIENLKFWAALSGQNDKLISDALSQADLMPVAQQRTSNLSRGQQRRLALCRLIIEKRPIWLLDEPTAALDSAGDQWVAELLSDHLADGGFAMVATHKPLNLRDGAPTKNLSLRLSEQVAAI